MIRNSSVGNHGKRAHAVQGILEELFRLRLWKALSGKIDEHGEFMFDFEARIDVLGIPQTVNEQAGSNQSDERKSDLHHDQNTTQSVPACASGG